MAHEVVMPQLGLTMTEGTLVRWLKAEGEEVAKGEPLIEVQSDKVTMEIESTGAGVLGGVRAKEGDLVPVGQVIGYLLEAGEAPPEGEPSRAEAPAPSPRRLRRSPSRWHGTSVRGSKHRRRPGASHGSKGSRSRR